MQGIRAKWFPIVLAASSAGACTSSDPARPPDCPTHATAPSGGYPRSALPSGACDSEETCQLPVLDCDTPGALGPINGYVCSCASGTWSCKISQPGGAYCPSDAGTTRPPDMWITDAGRTD